MERMVRTWWLGTEGQGKRRGSANMGDDGMGGIVVAIV